MWGSRKANYIDDKAGHSTQGVRGVSGGSMLREVLSLKTEARLKEASVNT